MQEYSKVQDSGKREEFSTGSVRDTRVGKGRFDLIPAYALKRVALHFEHGGMKYNSRNWERGQYLSRYLDSSIRHLYSYLGGDRSEDHMAAVAWNALAYMETEKRIECGVLPKELDDVSEIERNLEPMNKELDKLSK